MWLRIEIYPMTRIGNALQQQCCLQLKWFVTIHIWNSLLQMSDFDFHNRLALLATIWNNIWLDLFHWSLIHYPSWCLLVVENLLAQICGGENHGLFPVDKYGSRVSLTCIHINVIAIISKYYGLWMIFAADMSISNLMELCIGERTLGRCIAGDKKNHRWQEDLCHKSIFYDNKD